MEQSYRSTISIYKSILEQFNPALENLVYLGNKYVRAFHALSEAADVYFTAIQKIGEQALQSSTSQILGEILIQMSDTQLHLNRNLELVAQAFHVDLLQHMEKNTKLDMQFINESRQRYEKEYHRRAANIDKCMSDLWRMERTRDKNAREMKENMMHLHSEMQAFVTESERAAELEEKRRYRFLAEKHHLLSSTFLQFYTRARGIIQKKAPLWKEQLEASHNSSQIMLSTPHNQGHTSGSVTPTHLDMPQRPVSDFSSMITGRSSSPFLQEPAEMIPSPQPEPRRKSLPRTPSLGSLPTGQRSRSSSLGDQVAGGAEARGLEGGGGNSSTLKVQAIAPHSAGSNRTLLQFSLGDVVTVLIPEAQNGWLYGKLEGTSTSGWFPEAFVKPLEEVKDPEEMLPRTFPLRGSHSMDDLLDRPSSQSTSDYWHSTSRPQSPSPSLTLLGAGSRRSSMANATTATSDAKVHAGTLNSMSSNYLCTSSSRSSRTPPPRTQKSGGREHPPELFPRGTNPFATVKLRPTVTNDRSAPVIH